MLLNLEPLLNGCRRSCRYGSWRLDYAICRSRRRWSTERRRYRRRWCRHLLSWCWTYTNVVHEMVKRRLDAIHLRQDSKLTNLPMMMTRPTSNIITNVMERLIQSAELLLDGSSVMLVLSRMDVFCHLQNLIRLAVRFPVPRIVRVVVMQIEAELRCQRL